MPSTVGIFDFCASPSAIQNFQPTIPTYFIVDIVSLEHSSLFVPRVNFKTYRGHFHSLTLPVLLLPTISSLFPFLPYHYTQLLLDPKMSSGLPPWRVNASVPTSKHVAFQPSGMGTRSGPPLVPVGLVSSTQPTIPPEVKAPRQRIEFPPGVRLYVQRCFALENQVTSVSPPEIQEKLRQVITEAAENNKLHITDWERVALPQAMIQNERNRVLVNPNVSTWGMSGQPTSPTDASRKRTSTDSNQDRHQPTGSRGSDNIERPSFNREPPRGPRALVDPPRSSRAPTKHRGDFRDRDWDLRDRERDARDPRDRPSFPQDLDHDWRSRDRVFLNRDRLSEQSPVEQNRKASIISGRPVAHFGHDSDRPEPARDRLDPPKDLESVGQGSPPVAPQIPAFGSVPAPILPMPPLVSPHFLQPESVETGEGGNSIPRQSPQSFHGLERFRITVPPTDSGYASIAHGKLGYSAVFPQEEHSAETVDDVQTMSSDEEGSVSPHAVSSARNAEDDGGDDAQSIYTAGPSLSPFKQQNFISELAEDLFNKVCLDENAHQAAERIHSILPRLLKAFAMRFGQFGSTQMHRDVMIFIRQHRRLVLLLALESFPCGC